MKQEKNKVLFTLKPDWLLLNNYGYYRNNQWTHDIKMENTVSSDSEVIFHTLNNIPFGYQNKLENVWKLKSKMESICRNYGLKDLADTLIYISLDQADWYFAQLNSFHSKYLLASKVKKDAILMAGLQSSELKIELKANKKTVAFIENIELIDVAKNSLINRLISDWSIPIDLQYDLPLVTSENLAIFANMKVVEPIHLEHKLRTIFISKLHEFISKETVFGRSKEFFTRKQRELIYELGRFLALFPDRTDGQYSEYIKQLYRDNIDLFKRVAQSGSIDISKFYQLSL